MPLSVIEVSADPEDPDLIEVEVPGFDGPAGPAGPQGVGGSVIGQVALDASIQGAVGLVLGQADCRVILNSVQIWVSSVTGDPGPFDISVGSSDELFTDVVPSSPCTQPEVGTMYSFYAVAAGPFEASLFLNIINPTRDACTIVATAFGDCQEVPEIAVFDIADIPGYQSWYKSDLGFFQDAAKSTAATTQGTHRVYVWTDSEGVGPDISALDLATRPTLAAGGGGIVGNAVDQQMQVAGLLEPPFTLAFRMSYGIGGQVQRGVTWELNAGAAVAILHDEGSAGAGTPHGGELPAFYVSTEASGVYVATDTEVDIIWGVAVDADGVYTVFRDDGSKVVYTEELAATDADTILYLLSQLGSSHWTDDNQIIRDIWHFNQAIRDWDWVPFVARVREIYA